MPRFKLKFDEFFKRMAKAYFPLFGYDVETEVELFKLPKKMDVLILHTDKVNTEKIKKQFSIFTYFLQHNIISFKSLNDKIASENDILDLLTYTSGYVRSNRSAKPQNTSATLLTSRISKTFLRKYNDIISQRSKCHYILNLNMFSLHIIDLSQLEIIGVDSYFLANYAPADFLSPLVKMLENNKTRKTNRKIIDKLKETLYIRIRSFENEADWRTIMPATLEADITDMVMPYYEKGELKKAIEIARRMKKLGAKETFIIETTGLTKSELKKHKI